MSVSFELEAVSRSDTGKGASRRLRKTGMVPGIVYGAGKDPEMISVAHNELIQHLDHEAFYSHILTLNVDGSAQNVACIVEADLGVGRKGDLNPVVYGTKGIHGRGGILFCVNRLDQPGPASPFFLTVAPRGFHFLNVSAIGQHDLAQIDRGRSRQDRTREPCPRQFWNETAMVDMGMG